MSKVTVSALLLAAFAFGCAAASVGSRFVVPPARAGTSPTRWEYICVHGREEVTANANRLGAQELSAAAGVGATPSLQDMIWCFKRALPQ